MEILYTIPAYVYLNICILSPHVTKILPEHKNEVLYEMEQKPSFPPTPRFEFKQAEHFLFFYEDTHVLLLVWERDYTKALYVVLDQKQDGTFVIDYPGTLFTERLMDLVDSVFFIQVQEQDIIMRYALGAYFEEGGTWYGAYYPRSEKGSDISIPEIVLFKIVDQGGTHELKELDTNEHKLAAEAFMKRYKDILDIS
jgi:hypothetical protein